MNEMIDVVQLQAQGSALVYLYELELPSGDKEYFHPGVNESLQRIQFRDSQPPYTVREYIPLPMEMGGVGTTSDGVQPRPTLTIANVLSTFRDALGGKDYKDLLGSRITRRITLEKYLVGETGDSTPPVEYPQSVFILDRIQERSVLHVIFELSNPFDLEGVQFPGRQIIGGLCPWKYKGARPTLAEHEMVGGCNWYEDSPVGLIFANKDDEYVVPDSISFTTYSGTSTADGFYRTLNTEERLNIDGTTQTDDANNYWRARQDDAGDPDTNPANYQRLRVYREYNAAETYRAFRDKDYNDYVLYQGELWQVKQVTLDANEHPTVPMSNRYWKRADACGRRLGSCSMRFHAVMSGGAPSAVDKQRQRPLPFGGFPGSRQYR